MAPRQMSSIVDSGDVLLFTSQSKPADIQRMITGSRYDHVAMFLVSNPHEKSREVYVFEATSNLVRSDWSDPYDVV